MNKFTGLLWLTATAVSIIAAYRRSQEAQRLSERRAGQPPDPAQGLRVTTSTLPNGDQMVRFRGSWEDLLRLSNPNYDDERPEVPDDLDIEALPSYHCGCPHCGKMSLMGESQWRYQELSRTRGPYDNTTTFLTKCKNCLGFMKSTVDHDD